MSGIVTLLIGLLCVGCAISNEEHQQESPGHPSHHNNEAIFSISNTKRDQASESTTTTELTSSDANGVANANLVDDSTTTTTTTTTEVEVIETEEAFEADVEERAPLYPGLGIFAAIIVPLSLLIGLATATVGFTSWSILVPLLWVGFDIDVYDALLTAIATDALNSSCMLTMNGLV
jgi:hypothetical protein